MSDTCVPSLIVNGTAINQLETKVSLKTICCLSVFVVVLVLYITNSTIAHLDLSARREPEITYTVLFSIPEAKLGLGFALDHPYS